MREIGSNIRRRRKELGLSQSELASYIGKSPAAVSQYEKGTINPSTETLRAIATALGVEPSELIDRVARPVYGPDDMQLLGYFKQLNEKDKRVLIATARAMLEEEQGD